MGRYTVGTGFSGIGVPDLAARLLGMHTVWQIERDPFCQKVLRKNFPEVEILIGDIFDAHNLPHVDIEVFGFPCQPFSLAGKRQGERDPRYLVPEMLRVIDETKPRVCLLENVPGFASIDDGRTFKRLLGALAEMGLDAEWGHLRASDFEAPHQRERFWLITYASEKSGGDTCQELGNPKRSGCNRHAWRRSGAQLAHRHSQLEDSSGERLQECHFSEGVGSAQLTAGRFGANGESGQWGTKPGLGRVIDGCADRLDGFIPYPARPGEQQYDFEPPRLTMRRDQRSPRLKALGNTMAFDVAFALMAAIQSWLVEQDDAMAVRA
jgi:DNA (cytosine-5)-methyltransferase 1